MPPIQQWTLEKIRDGFEKFIQEHQRLPTSPEVDASLYLPSSRQIQRLFGGLPQVRELLGYSDTNFSKGSHRQNIAHAANRISRETENKVRDILFEKFHEPFVHIERPIDSLKKTRTDFFVFNPLENFCVDVFATETSHNLGTHLHIKLKKYSHIQQKIYFVLFSENLTEGDIRTLLSNRKEDLPKTIQVVTLPSFIKIISLMPAYPNPIHF